MSNDLAQAETDNSPEAVRGRVAEIAESYVGNPSYAKGAAFPGWRDENNWGKGTNKCNCFVAAVAEQAGVEFPSNKYGYPPTANALANEGVDPKSHYEWDMSGWQGVDYS